MPNHAKKPLSTTQVIYISLTGDITTEPGTCRICGGPLIGGSKKHSECKWDNWNSENTVRAFYSDRVCGACLYLRSAISSKGNLKLNKGFIASISAGFKPFMEKQDILDTLKHLPEPPFVLTAAFTYVRTNYPFVLPVSYSTEQVRMGLIMGRKREIGIMSGTPGKYSKVSPAGEEAYIVDFEPAELLGLVETLKKHEDEIYTREFRDLCLTDPYWALAFWLTDLKAGKLYKTMPYLERSAKTDDKS